MIYLFIVNIALVLGWFFYCLFLKDLTFFQLNRSYLLIMTISSFILPLSLFCDFSSYVKSYDSFNMVYPFLELNSFSADDAVNEFSINPISIVICIYLLGVLYGIILLLKSLFNLVKSMKSTNHLNSFSFFNKIVIAKNLKHADVIMAHEQVHVRQGHSYDLILMELMVIFTWFNPFSYLIRRELKFQHECLADTESSIDKVHYAKLLLSHAMHIDVNLLTHEFSNPSLIKKRIHMLFKDKSSNWSKLYYLAIFPLLFVVALPSYFLNPSVAKESNFKELNQIQNHIVSDTTDRQTQEEMPEILAEPKGGSKAFFQWIGSNYKFPDEAVQAGVRGTIICTFTIEDDGSITDIQVKQDLGYGTGEAAKSLLEKAEKWLPAMQDGKAVSMKYTLPIRIDLSNM